MKPALASLALLAAAAAVGAQPVPAPAGPPDYSAAERLLFLSKQMTGLAPGAALHYRFERSGSRDAAFADDVQVTLSRRPDGSCCVGRGEFLSGERRVALPDVDDPDGNPVVLHFLEHDIRDMQHATQGAAAYFRKRIRMALYQGASVVPVNVQYQGRRVAAQQIAFLPYQDDPNRARFESYVLKRYVFTLSPDVPGGVVQMSASVPGSGTTPLVEDVLTLQGASL